MNTLLNKNVDFSPIVEKFIFKQTRLEDWSCHFSLMDHFCESEERYIQLEKIPYILKSTYWKHKIVFVVFLPLAYVVCEKIMFSFMSVSLSIGIFAITATKLNTCVGAQRDFL